MIEPSTDPNFRATIDDRIPSNIPIYDIRTSPDLEYEIVAVHRAGTKYFLSFGHFDWGAPTPDTVYYPSFESILETAEKTKNDGYITSELEVGEFNLADENYPIVDLAYIVKTCIDE